MTGEAIDIPKWGIDSASSLTDFDSSSAEYLNVLQQSGLGWVRMRNLPLAETPQISRVLAALKRAKIRVIAFCALPPGGRASDRYLPDDLVEVYQYARNLASCYKDRVSAWEMIGEPDIGYCPANADESTAVQKALYLGLKTGAPTAIVAMGALALPPGPWLECATENGLLLYTDIYNFHFYGYASDFNSVVSAHERFLNRNEVGELTATHSIAERIARLFARRRSAPKPLWITECGLDSIGSASDLLEARRSQQGQFLQYCAQQASRNSRIEVFCPFVLYHKNDGFSLFTDPMQPLPAWTLYSNFTHRTNEVSKHLLDAVKLPSSVVMLWRPDIRTCKPYKPSSSYRFMTGSNTITGSLRIYNLGESEVSTTLAASSESGTQVSIDRKMTKVASMSCVSVPVEIKCESQLLYVFQKIQFISNVVGEGKASQISFYVERAPALSCLRELNPQPITFRSGNVPAEPDSLSQVSGESGEWIGMNGVVPYKHENGNVSLRVLPGAALDDPWRPLYLYTGIGSVPDDGFLLLDCRGLARGSFAVRVDLIDKDSHRYTIWENFGREYGSTSDRVWLRLADFHPHFWGPCAQETHLHGRDVRIMEFRIYSTRAARDIKISYKFFERKI